MPDAPGRVSVGAGNAPDGSDSSPANGLLPGSPNPCSLRARGHLVRLEINSGKGRLALPEGTTAGVFATDVAIEPSLDSDAIEGAVTEARARLRAAIAERGYVPNETWKLVDIIVPTFLRATKQLEVRILLKSAGTEALGCAPGAMGNDHCRCAFQGSVIGAHYRFSAGQIVEEIRFTPLPAVVSVMDGRVSA